ncbi:outer membrane beta-barrel protein, partial [Myxococcota bacterium]|nr:outer membrane beta-barrel protein [Myxococcota bacterium]
MTAALTAFAMLGLAPSFAMAGEVEVQLQQMQQRLQQMEDKLQATNDQLGAANQRVDEQSELIEGAGLTDTRGASSGLGCLVCDWTIGGWVAASYNYNLNDPQDGWVSNPDYDPGRPEGPDNRPYIDGLGGTNLGSGLFYDPLHPDHNTFSLDQVWFEIEKEVSEESRAGFRTDFVYGKTAKYLNGGGPFNASINDDTALYVYQAYVQYAPPIGPEGTVMKAGKF